MQRLNKIPDGRKLIRIKKNHVTVKFKNKNGEIAKKKVLKVSRKKVKNKKSK